MKKLQLLLPLTLLFVVGCGESDWGIESNIKKGDRIYVAIGGATDDPNDMIIRGLLEANVDGMWFVHKTSFSWTYRYRDGWGHDSGKGKVMKVREETVPIGSIYDTTDPWTLLWAKKHHEQVPMPSPDL